MAQIWESETFPRSEKYDCMIVWLLEIKQSNLSGVARAIRYYISNNTLKTSIKYTLYP